MSEGTPQTHISVKKSDGTVVRMTLAEFKVYRAQSASAKPMADKQVTSAEEVVASDDLLVIDTESPHELATTTPVTDLFVNEAKAKVWASSDHKSLLEEEIGEHELKIKNGPVPTIPSRDSALLHAVLDGLPFPIPEPVLGRLQSLIESRIKDVRSDDDVLVYATRPEAEGGLGLFPEQGATLLDTILDTLNLPPSSDEALVDEDEHQDEARIVSSPAPINIEQQEVPPVSTQKKSASVFSYDQTGRDEMPWQPRFSPEPRPAATSAIPSAQDGRPMVHDVQMPQQAARPMGPIDEFREFTVTDLHRLGTTPERITEIMTGKFMVLRDESFVLYLDAVDAFRQSPLYRRYQSHLLTAVNEGISLQTALDYDEEGMTMSDVEVLVGILKAIHN